jgi:DNA (cytosine-5)-methyltransferase 1
MKNIVKLQERGLKMNNKVVDLFSGVGGLSLGFRMAGFQIVIANEIDEQIAEAYIKNHPDTTMINDDITKMDIKEIFKNFKDVQVVIGGPPCQGFSQKGKREILDDPRNYLFKYFYDVVNYIKPEYFVIENVPNILTAHNGIFKKEIYNLFEKIGYSLNSGILNAADYGVPQYRKRAFIIGKKCNQSIKMPKKGNETITAWDAISDLAYLNSGEGEFKSDYILPYNNEYQKRMRYKSEYLYNHIATKHNKIVLERMSYIPENGGRGDLPEEHKTKSIYSGTWGRIVKNEPSVTITTRFDTPSSGRFTHPFLNRAITVREAARLQSFPDDFVFYGSKMSQMKEVGNAVPPLLAYAIAKQIKEDMEV